MGLDSWVCVRDEDFPAYVDFKEDFSEREGDPAGPEFGDSVLYHWKDHWDLHLWMDNLYERKGGSASDFDSFNNAPVAVTGYDVEALERAIESGNLPLGNTVSEYKEGDRAFIALARAALEGGGVPLPLAKRLESAQELVRRDAVKPTDRPDLFRVGYSGSSSQEVGTGSFSQPAGCTCPDYGFRGSQLGGWCKHRLAVEIYVGAHPEAARLTEQAAREKLERDIADLF